MSGDTGERPDIVVPASATGEVWSFRRSFLVWLPVWTMSVLLVVGWIAQPSQVFDPAWVFTPLNLVFLTIVPVAAAGLAIPAYRKTGMVALLALGAGMLVTGLGGGVLPAVMLYVRDLNSTVTMHNAAAALAASCQLVAAFAGVLALSLGPNRRRHVVVAYGALTVVTGLILVLTLVDLTPNFWEEGPTLIRQVTVFIAIAFAALSAALWWVASVRDPTIRFLRWYVPGLALLALGLAAIFFQSVVGGLVGWIGRLGQYSAAVYMLIAAWVEFEALGSRTGGSLGESLLQASLPLRTLVESTSDAVILVGRRGRVVYWNEAAHRLFGYTSGEAADCQAADLMLCGNEGAEAREALRAMLVRASASPQPDRRQMRLADREGNDFHAEVTVFPNPTDRRLTICLVSDVSERVRARLELERRVLERTAELESLNDELERALAAKDEFLGLVSHELKTPITAIITAGSMLRRRLADADESFLVEDLMAESARLAGIIDNLLALARIESGRQPEHEPLLLDHVLSQAVRSVARQFPDREVSVESRPEVVVEANEDQLAMVLSNYLGNALKYSPSDSIVEARITTEDGCAVTEILDRGIGIEGEDLPALYEPFYRGSGSARTQGMGIGLAVCRRIVESLGGSVSARPRPDGGSIFSFTLPLVRVEPEEGRSETTEEPAPSHPGAAQTADARSEQP